MPGVNSILEEVIAEVSEYDSEEDDSPVRNRRRRQGAKLLDGTVIDDEQDYARAFNNGQLIN